MKAGRVLVTGASGFVGRPLCAALAQAGFEVTAAVRSAPAVPLQGVDRVVEVGAMGPGTDWTPALAGCSGLIHLAARAHRGEATDTEAVAAFDLVNRKATETLVRQAVLAGVGRFVYLSSSKVYGERSLCDDRGRPLPFESDSPLNPAGPYGASKLAAENLLVEQVAATGRELVILRPPLVYGPGNKANLLALMRALAAGCPLPFASLRNLRSLIYVENLVSAVLCALQAPLSGILRLPLSDCDLSTPELLRQLARGMDSTARLFPLPVTVLKVLGVMTGKHSAVARLTDSMLVGRRDIQRELGWSPAVPLEVAMRATGQWYRQRS